MRNWWWDATWNPVGGCSPVSPGCTNCYAAALAANYIQYGRTTPANVVPLHPGVVDLVNGRPHFTGHMTAARRGHPLWTRPLEWPGATHPKLGDGKPSLIFVGDMSDLFHEDRPEESIDRVIGTIALADHHVFLLLTKRTARMADYFSKQSSQELRRWRRNMWLGFSAERQKEFDERWRDMRPLADAGFLIFASVAPMLAEVVLPDTFLALKDRAWCIVAGEQGPAPDWRYMDPAWARALRDQCAAAGVAFFLKQMAARNPVPPDLRVRQFPAMRSSRWIFNIRGTSGSGKSWLARRWLQSYPTQPLYGLFGTSKPEAYECVVPGVERMLYVLGPYETPCGGCDSILPYGLILGLLRKYAARGHVLFEGLLIGDSYGSVGALLDQLSGEGVSCAVIRLNTPLDECLERVQQRRSQRGDRRPLNPKNTIAHFERSLNSKRLFEVEGSRATWLDLSAEEANAAILRMLMTR
jgi:protein gp37